MGICYLIALVPFVAGAILWLTSRRITFSEWIKGAVIGFGVAAIFHVIAIWTQTVDFEMWSGRIVRATHHPEWVGKSSDDSHDVYPEKWSVTADYGGLEERYEITHEEFEAFREQFGVDELETREPYKRGFASGDPHVYVAENETGHLIPAYTVRLFENRVKASESLFSYSDVPDDAEVHDYPAELDEGHLTALAVDFVSKYIDPAARDDEVMILPREWRRSPRLLGRAAEDFDLDAWDGLNAELGPAHHVNLIAIGFEGDRSNALWQEAKWTGGKKNDLVLCYGPPVGDGRPSWAYCFGWSEGEVVKRKLESILLAQPVGDALLPAIRAEVAQNYVPRSWPEFSYLSVPAPTGAYWVLVLVTIFIQGGYWTYAFLNRTHREALSDSTESPVRLDSAVGSEVT